MPNVQHPLFSLAAQGTIADTLTYQGRDSGTTVRTKPIPTQRLTLPVQYQRWLYEDYCYLWRQQSEATKATYRATGGRHHLTAFQYWLKYHLTHLPDIAGYWKLDVNNQPTTPDSSRNAHTGTVIGASPATGRIDRCLSFDGINDLVKIADHADFGTPLANALSIEAYVNHARVANQHIVAKNQAPGNVSWSLYVDATDHPALVVLAGGIMTHAVSAVALTTDTWHHVIGTYDRTNVRIFLDGSIQGTTPHNLPVDVSTTYIAIGGAGTTTHDWKGLIDQVTIYNRALDATDAYRHSLRRWPPE